MRITIDGQVCEVQSGQTIIQAADANGIEIPRLCWHPDQSVKANCRICVVQVDGTKGLQTACSTPVTDGMIVNTQATAVTEARRTNLELIFGEHKLECDDCVLRYNCSLLKYAAQYQARITRFACRKAEAPIYQFGPIILDQTKCIDCRNCVEACPVKYLEVDGRGDSLNIKPTADKKRDCISCGQCIVTCPVGAIESEGEFEELKIPFKDKSKVVVVGIAPSVRATIGEMFGLPAGTLVADKLPNALRQAGFHHVFDTSVFADFTTIEESKELIERIETGGKLPMFTSCCPAWVEYVEFYHPELIPNLTTVRSPHIIFGAMIKSYWAEQMKLNPKDIIVVSVVPCTAKKYEAERPQLKRRGRQPVDFVFTTRELGFLLEYLKIDLAQAESGKFDNPFGEASGAGVIYGASGGVMEAALRSSYFMLSGQELLNFDIKEVRGLEGFKTAEVELMDKKKKKSKLKVAVMNGMKNIDQVMTALKVNEHAFDYVEIMACPGGCIGGGGQPIPNSSVIRQARAKALYRDDRGNKIRTAHNDANVNKISQDYLTSEAKIKPICHTKYRRAGRNQIKLIKDSKKPNTDFGILKKYLTQP
jgi:iron-only hydrogenase group A